MLSQPWQAAVRRIVDGMPVAASSINPPLSDLAKRDEYLKALLDELNYGEALMIREAPVSDDVVVGMPVYLDTQDGEFKPGLAAVDFTETGEGRTADSAYVWGVVSYKYTSTSADVVTSGVIRNLSLVGLVEDPTESGPLYLSAAEEGHLSLQKQPASSFVMYWWAEAQVALVSPTPREVLESHVHYRFELTAAPAGTPNAPVRTLEVAQKQSIVTPDTDEEGWLPAASFPDAPAGAKFGYNLVKHPELNAVFPPVPVSNYYVEVVGGNRGTSRADVVVDHGGIWWMDDDYGFAPWSPTLAGTEDLLVANSDKPIPPELVDAGGDNPWTDYPQQIYFWFTKMVYKTSDATVTSLTSSATSPIRIVDCMTEEPASSGNLRLDFELNAAVEEDLTKSDIGLVGISLDNTFQRGYRVSNISTDTPGSVEITGTEYDEDDATKKTGTVKVNFIGNQDARFIEPAIAALNNVREEQYQGVYFIGFLQNRTASLRLKFEMPAVLPGSAVDMDVLLKLRVMGTTLGVMPALTATVRVISAAAALTALPVADVAIDSLDLTTLNGGSAVPAYNYIDIDFPLVYTSSSEPVLANGGDTIYVEFTRTSGVGAYAGTVGFMRYPLILS
jgi:hypothetical protein